MSEKSAFVLIWFWVAAIASASTTNVNNNQLFQFKFEPNKPLTYAVEYKTSQMTDSEFGQRSSLTRSSVDTRYKIKLTDMGTNEDGTMAVYYEPFDYEQDSQSAGRSGQIDTTIRSLAIVRKENGIETINTDRGIGLSQSQSVKESIYPNLLSGYMDFQANGRLRGFGGDLPFIDHWQTLLKYRMNLFCIELPTNTIGIGDGWTNYCSVRSAGPITFNGDGIVQPWSYVRNLDLSTTNGAIACFSLYMSANYKDVSGYADQNGQQTAIDIPQHAQSMFGKFEFDQKRGRLIEMTESDTLHEDINMMLQGNPITSHADSEGSMSITLISP